MSKVLPLEIQKVYIHIIKGWGILKEKKIWSESCKSKKQCLVILWFIYDYILVFLEQFLVINFSKTYIFFREILFFVLNSSLVSVNVQHFSNFTMLSVWKDAQ